MSIDLNINPKFRDLLDLPTDTERKELESQLIRDKGPRDPIVVWQETNTIVDGHNRYAICRMHNLHFKVEYRSFTNEIAVEEWILENQLARRNLSPARSNYYLGLLYNTYKQDPTKARQSQDGEKTSEKIAKKFGVSEKTVRRAGDEVKGIDVVAKVKGVALESVTAKLNAIKDKNTGTFNKEELQELGKASEKEGEQVAVEAAKIMVEDKTKQAILDAKAKLTKTTTPAPAKKEPPKKVAPYNVVLTAPSFDKTGWTAASEERPALAEHAVVYMVTPDEELPKALDLLKKWGLNYEASYIFKAERYEGIWSDVIHQFLIVGTKGTPLAPKKMEKSIMDNGDIMKTLDNYHNGVRKLDMRKDPAKGWEKKA